MDDYAMQHRGRTHCAAPVGWWFGGFSLGRSVLEVAPTNALELRLQTRTLQAGRITVTVVHGTNTVPDPARW
jgi:hypothetical protein